MQISFHLLLITCFLVVLVYIHNKYVDSPALVAGLRYKDIVTKIDSKIIDGEGSVQDFIKIVRENPNKNLQLEVIRDAKVSVSYMHLMIYIV